LREGLILRRLDTLSDAGDAADETDVGGSDTRWISVA